MNNPWVEQHVAAETDFQEGNGRLARRLVANEYAGAPDPLPCPCGGHMHYKATIGAMKCPDCGQLAFEDGELI